MAGPDTDVIELETETLQDDLQTDDAATEGETPNDEAAVEGEQQTDDETDSVVVTIGDEAPPPEDEAQAAPAWVKDLRKSNREKDRQIRELERKLKANEPAPKAVEVGDKPTLQGCDFDESDYEQKLEAWHARKREADDRRRQQEEEASKAQAAWQLKLDAYGKAKAELKVGDFEDAEAVVQELLSVTQHGVIVHGSDNSALLTYALGKNPAKCKDLAAIADPVKFAFAVAKLETQLKVTPRKSAPLPERPLRSSAAGAASVDSTLERLRAEADRTGDRTKVAAYMRKQGSGSK